VHIVSQWPNLSHLGESLGGAECLMEAVSFKKATILLDFRTFFYQRTLQEISNTQTLYKPKASKHLRITALYRIGLQF